MLIALQYLLKILLLLLLLLRLVGLHVPLCRRLQWLMLQPWLVLLLLLLLLLLQSRTWPLLAVQHPATTCLIF
jgi:hypothetical protein